MGIRDRPISPRWPWQNGHVERLIGSIRRECLDHVVVLGEGQLRRLLAGYAEYHNAARTHLALGKDTPHGRPVRASGPISAVPILGGLHITTSGPHKWQAHKYNRRYTISYAREIRENWSHGKLSHHSRTDDPAVHRRCSVAAGGESG